MLNHQIEFSKAVQEIYKPISGRVSDPDSIIPEGNPDGIRACEEYEAIVRDLLATLQPELEMIESRVIAPAQQLLEVIKVIQKVAVKRQHKQLDYDRHRMSLKKLQDKKEKTLKDEKALFKAENDVEQATQDFNYFNDLLKDELPKLFALEAEFIRPLFQSFYYMQLNVFYTLHERMQDINIGYFDLTLDIEEAFEAKRGTIREQTEALSIIRFKTTGGLKGPRGSKYGRKPQLALEDRKKKPLSITNGSEILPPPYSAGPSSSVTTSPSASPNAMSAAIAAKGKPPPPKPKPSRLSGIPNAETVTALYDYEAQAEGDLSFSTGDTIEIVSRTANENEWWIGKIRGRQGQFPGRLLIFSPDLTFSKRSFFSQGTTSSSIRIARLKIQISFGPWGTSSRSETIKHW
jgi:amphiphysin